MCSPVMWGAPAPPASSQSLPTTPGPSACTFFLPVLRAAALQVLKGEAQAVSLPCSCALSAGLELNLCKKYTAKTALTHMSPLSSAVSALESQICPVLSYVPSSCLELPKPCSVPPGWELCPFLQQRAQAINACERGQAMWRSWDIHQDPCAWGAAWPTVGSSLHPQLPQQPPLVPPPSSGGAQECRLLLVPACCKGMRTRCERGLPDPGQLLEVSRSLWERRHGQQGCEIHRRAQCWRGDADPPMPESHAACCLLLETTALVMAEQPLLRDNSRDGFVLSCPVLLVLH